MASDGDRIGLQLLELVKKRHLAIINPPAAYVLQWKTLLWLIGERRSDPLLFTAEERAAIQQFMLPTYLTAEHFIREDIHYEETCLFS